MKKHLLFNQLFGTEGSPNQTGETLTRENRIGLMSYLRRTLMLLIAVLMLSIANIGMAWGTTVTCSSFSSSQSGTTRTISANGVGNSLDGVSVTGTTSNLTVSSNRIKFTASGTFTVAPTSGANVITAVSIGWRDSKGQYPTNSDDISSDPSGATTNTSTKVTSWSGSSSSVTFTNGTSNELQIISLSITYGAAAASYKLGGSWNSFSEHTMSVSDGMASYSVDLDADSRYEFYLKDNGTAYKSNGTIMAPGGWVFTTGENNAYIHTGPAGTYTFSMNTSTHAVSVTYPSVTHPSDHYVYFKNSDVWGTVHAYLRDDADSKKAAAWPGSPTATTTICDQTYHYAALNGMNGTYTKIQFNDGYSGYGHETSVLSVSGSAAKYNANRDANWYEPAISITFDKNGGTGTMDKIVGICSGDDKTLPANTTITRTGWEFDGWNTNKYGSGDSYDDGATIEGITSDITLYAQWKKVVYMQATGDLSWWYNDNAWFVVWCTNSDESESAWVAMEKAENCSDPAIYKATIPGNGWTKFTFVRKNPADKTVIGWGNKWNHTSKEADPTTNNKFTITGGSGDNCTGTWGSYSTPTFTISYAGGTASKSGSKSDETKTCDVAFTLPSSAVFTRSGYTQTGWTTSDGGDQTHELGGSYTVNNDQTFYPVWTGKTYTITYKEEDKTTVIDGLSPSSYTCGEGATLPTPAARSCYTFDGWYKSSCVEEKGAFDSGCKRTAISSSAYGNYTFYGKWTLNSHTLAWNFNGGTTEDPYTAAGTVNCGADLTIPTLTKTGYTFDAWSSDDTEMPDNDLTLTASWTANKYTVTLDPDNGNSTSTVSATYDAAMPSKLSDGKTDVAVPEFTGYTFGGYYDDHCGGGDQYYTNAVASANNWDKTSATTLYAKWTQTVTLKTGSQGSGSDLTPSVLYNGTALSGFSSGHTAKGYRLLGYYTASSEGTKVLNADGTFAASAVTDYITGGKWTKANATTLYAQWEDMAVDLPGTLNKANNIETGGGLTFDGNYFNYSNTAGYAEWKVNIAQKCMYTVTINGNYTGTGRQWEMYLVNGSGTTVSTCTYGGKWDTGDQSYTKNWDLSGIDATGTYIVRLKNIMNSGAGKVLNVNIDPIKVTYNANGGSCATTSAYYAGSALILPTPTRDGYLFLGWFNGDTKIGNAGGSYSPTASITLTAKWCVPIELPGTLDKDHFAEIGGGLTFSEDYFNYGTGSNSHLDGYAEWKVNVAQKCIYKVTLSGTYTNGHQWAVYLVDGSGSTVETCTITSTYTTGTYTETKNWDLSGISATGTYTIRVKNIMEHGSPKLLNLVIDPVTVTYNANGGSCATESAYYAGSALTLPTPTWSGYTFEGWYNAGTKIGDADDDYTPDPVASITLYAHWTDDISGKVFSYIDGVYGDKYKAFDASTWVTSDGSDVDKTYTNATTGVQFIVDNGYWDNKTSETAKAISSLAKFKNGTTAMSVVIPTGKIATVKIGYGAFHDTKKDKDNGPLTIGGVSQTTISTALENGLTNAEVDAALKEVTLSSQQGTLTFGSDLGNIYIGRVSAEITGYVITYAAGDYGSGSLAAGTKTVGSGYTISSTDDAFTRTNCVYDGWSTNSDGSTKDYDFGDTYSTDAALTLYPHWVATCSTPAEPTDFSAGSITDGGVTFTITDDEDAGNYDIYYSTDDDAPDAETEVMTTATAKSKAVTGLSAGTTYYAWVRAVCDEDHKSDWVALNPDGDTHTFFTDYTITIGAVTTRKPGEAAVGGTISAAASHAAEGGTVTLTATPNDGYGFVEWTIEKTSDNSDVTSSVLDGNTLTMPAYGVTVKAIFAKQYSIGYKDHDKTTVLDLSPTSYLYGTGVASLPTPTKTGYTFDSWYSAYCVDTEHSGDWDAGCKKTSIGTSDYGSATYYASWTANNYTLTWDLAGGTVTTAGTGAAVDATGTPSSSVAYGSPITAPVVAKDGYSFAGWDVTPASTMPATDVTYTAQWSLSYSVTLNANGGTIKSGNVTSYTYGVGATLPTDVTKSGYTFNGWYDNSGLTGDAVTTIADDATGNKAYWAKWTALEEICETLNTTWLDAYAEAKGEGTYGTISGVKYDIEYSSDDESSITMSEGLYFTLDIGSLGKIKEVVLTIDAVGTSSGSAGIYYIWDDNVDWYDWGESSGHFSKTSLSTGSLSLTCSDDDKTAFRFYTNGTTLTISNICIYYKEACFTFSKGTKGTEPTDGFVMTPSNINSSAFTAGATLSGGNMTNTSGGTLNINGNHGFVMKKNEKEITLTLTGGQFQEGTVIELEGKTNSNSTVHTYGFSVSGNAASPLVTATASSNDDVKQRYVVTADDGVEGTGSCTIEMNSSASGSQTYLSAIKIYGCMSCTPITPTLSYSSSTIYADGGTPRQARPTITGNTGSGDVTYSSSNTDAVTVNSSTGVATAVAPGSATITARIASSGDYCGAVATTTLTVPSLVQQTINLNSAWSTVPNMTFPGDPTETLTKNANIAATGYSIDESNNKSGLSSKIYGIPSTTSKNDSYYMSLKFNTPSYPVRVTSVVVPIQPITNTASAIVTVSDGTTTVTSNEEADIPDGAKKTCTFTITPTVFAAGSTITVKIFVYDQSGDKGFRLSSPILVNGSVLKDQKFTGSGNWSNPANWDGGSVPESYHDVVISSGKTSTITSDVTVNNITIETGATLNVSVDGEENGVTFTANSLSLKGGLNSSGTKYDMPRVYIDPASSIVRTNSTINFDISVDATHYYPIAVPFPVDVADVDYVNETLAGASQYNKHFVIKKYDGANRAEKGADRDNNWVVMADGVEVGAATETLQPGVGYILTAVSIPAYGGGVIRFPMKNVSDDWMEEGEQATVSAVTKNQVTVTAHTGTAAAAKTVHKGWNLLGVPYMSCFDASDAGASTSNTYMKGKVDFVTGDYSDTENIYVSVPVHDFSEYIQKPVSEAVLLPGWCFFVQIDNNGTLTFATTGQEQTSSLPIYAPKREQAMPTVKTGIILSSETASDKTTILVSDKYSVTDYEINADLEKMFGNGYTLATYSLAGTTRLAYNAMSNSDATNVIPIGYRAPADGEYTFAINPRYAENGAFEHVNLIDYETGFVTDLLVSSYTFDTERTQNDTRFALNIVKAPQTTTDIGNGDGANGERTNGVQKMIINDKLYIIVDGKMYDAKGVMVK